MRTWSADSVAEPAVAWALLARPRAWPAWAPHVRGAWGLGQGEVRQGALGLVWLLGLVPVPVRIIGKRPGRSWTWRIGPDVVMVHRMEPRARGCTVAIDLLAPAPLEAALAAAYGPVIAFTLRRLARIAAQEAPDAAGGPPRDGASTPA
jgi:Polyketide cyclase / dehydrase and lipid transport